MESDQPSYINTINQKVMVKIFQGKSASGIILVETLVSVDMSGHENFPHFFGVLNNSSRFFKAHIVGTVTLKTLLNSQQSLLQWSLVCTDVVRAIHALYRRCILHNDLTFRKCSNLICCKPGTEKHKQYNNFHLH